MAKDDANFSIIYAGDALAEGEIDARDLAPALLALADIFDEAQTLAADRDGRIALRVQSGFDKGSFEVHFHLASIYQQIVDLFSSPQASAWANIFQIVGISGVLGVAGLLQLIKKAKGRKPVSVTIERSERVRIVFEGDDPLEVDRAVWTLFNKARARKAVEQMIAPLFRRGIDTFKIRHKGSETFKVAQDEARFFDAPVEHEGEIVSSAETRVIIVAPSFQEGNKWRVSDGSRTIYVSISDPNFVQSVQAGREAFRKGDILRVVLETRQWMDGADLKAEYVIPRVLEHMGAPEQKNLPLP